MLETMSEWRRVRRSCGGRMDIEKQARKQASVSLVVVGALVGKKVWDDVGGVGRGMGGGDVDGWVALMVG